MYLTSDVKKEIFAKHSLNHSDANTGSPEAQVALFTHRINHITEHLKVSKKDHASRLSLMKLVGKRRSLLDYLYKNDIARYRALIAELNLRK